MSPQLVLHQGGLSGWAGRQGCTHGPILHLSPAAGQEVPEKQRWLQRRCTGQRLAAPAKGKAAKGLLLAPAGLGSREFCLDWGT